jgi:hypothetical protein
MTAPKVEAALREARRLIKWMAHEAAMESEFYLPTLNDIDAALTQPPTPQPTIRQICDENAALLKAAAAGALLPTPTPQAPAVAVPEGWKWMTHPTRFGGKPFPVRFLTHSDGTPEYQPFDDKATTFEVEKMGREWKNATHQPPAQPQAHADLREALKLIAVQDQGCGGTVTEAEAWRNARTIALAALSSSPPAQAGEAMEPVGQVYTMEALPPKHGVKHHATLWKPLPAGTKLYAKAQS